MAETAAQYFSEFNIKQKTKGHTNYVILLLDETDPHVTTTNVMMDQKKRSSCP